MVEPEVAAAFAAMAAALVALWKQNQRTRADFDKQHHAYVAKLEADRDQCLKDRSEFRTTNVRLQGDIAALKERMKLEKETTSRLRSNITSLQERLKKLGS